MTFDGVLANLETAIVQHSGIHYWDRMGGDHWTAMEKVPNLFYTLDLMPDALWLFDLVMQKYGTGQVEILTALPIPTGLLGTADLDKRAWVADVVHPTITVNTVLGGANKYKWAKENPNSLLIDDFPRNVKQWIKAGGIGILHTDPHSTFAKLKALKIL